MKCRFAWTELWKCWSVRWSRSSHPALPKLLVKLRKRTERVVQGGSGGCPGSSPLIHGLGNVEAWKRGVSDVTTDCCDVLSCDTHVRSFCITSNLWWSGVFHVMVRKCCCPDETCADVTPRFIASQNIIQAMYMLVTW